ncbi:4b58bd9d-08b4-4186-b050-c129f4a80113 [Thermothielavioides terrestris]|uniref:4b58bd9d-08b4-4186-b050-c129f4a80113 n=1 Tax=Thermothielavioides terrestris TaxID=2587410 RepID=A0A3S4AJW3_9PEZI|nr:4b58bd9d-08b4-4186-b050-c129f4a80113 [Thermothielavioides terrestris]
MAGHVEEGWNQVKRKGGRLRSVPAPANNGADSTVDDGIRPNPKPELSVDDLWRYHGSVAKSEEWQVSQWWHTVRQLLEEASSQPNRPVITQAVCLGPGPYEPSNETRSGREIKCVVQEPRFTQTDKEFCARLGLQVVENPDAFALVDENTLLFGIHMELDIYNQALASLPGIYVGAGLEEWEKVVDHDDGDSKSPLAAFSRMKAAYDQYPFPDLDYMFSSTVMYWRREQT